MHSGSPLAPRPTSEPTRPCRARRLGALVLAALVVLAGCAGQPPDGSAPSDPSRPASPKAVVPPATTSPSAPPARLVVRSWTCLACIYTMGTMVFDDGLVLRQDEHGLTRARRLAPEGLAWVQARIAESPLAEGAAQYGAVPAPGFPADLHEHTPHWFTVERDGATITVGSDTVPELEGGPKAWVIPDEMLALEQLSADLRNPDAWVPPGLWADTWAPYRADRFLLTVEPMRDSPPEDLPAGPDADLVPWPFMGLIDGIGTTRPGGDPFGTRCIVVGRQVVERVAAAEATVGMERSPDESFVTNEYRWERGNGVLWVGTRWLLPHEPSDCSVSDHDW